MLKEYDLDIEVKANDIDQMGHVNNVIYLQWAQAVAAAHWENEAASEYQEQYQWVVLRHEIDYIKPAFIGDLLKARTWIESLEGARSIRIVEIKRGEQLIVKTRTSWVILNANTGRPARIPAGLKAEFL